MKGDIRCVEGRLMRHDPQLDDPDLETDVGECPECAGWNAALREMVAWHKDQAGALLAIMADGSICIDVGPLDIRQKNHRESAAHAESLIVGKGK